MIFEVQICSITVLAKAYALLFTSSIYLNFFNLQVSLIIIKKNNHSET